MSFYKPKPDGGVVRILPNPRSSGIEPIYQKYYIRKSEDAILDSIGIEKIERYLRKKKLERIQNGEK